MVSSECTVCCTVLYCTVLHSVLYCVVQYSTHPSPDTYDSSDHLAVLYISPLGPSAYCLVCHNYCTAQYSTVPYCTVQYSTVQYCTLHSTRFTALTCSSWTELRSRADRTRFIIIYTGVFNFVIRFLLVWNNC